LLAFKQFVTKYPLARWMIVGEGPSREELTFYIHSLHLQDKVLLLGKKNRDEIIALYRQANVFFLPSVYEGIANVVLEAMAMQLPVVSTISGGMDEVIENGENGILCKNYDHVDMALQLSMLFEDAGLRNRLGSNARKTVTANFNIERQVQIFENEYRQLLRGAV